MPGERCRVCGSFTGEHGFSFDWDKKMGRPGYGQRLQEASVDDFGSPIPSVMQKIIDRYAPEDLVD